MLVVGFLAMTAGCTFQYGLPYALPALRAAGMPLSQAGLLVASPIAGLLLSLIAWGAAADRWGERRILTLGLGSAGLVLLAAVAAGGPVGLGLAFLLAGCASAAVHAASGRLILGWFPQNERGLAMSVRQTAQPLGVALAALVLPPLTTLGMSAVLMFLGIFCLATAVLVFAAVRDPQRPAPSAQNPTTSPYRTWLLWRVHTASALMVIPQFTVSTFALVYLIEALGWQAAPAGRLLAAAAIGGAAVRLLAGYWSDRVGARLRPFRILTLAVAAVMFALGAGVLTESAAALVALLMAAVITVSPNGLAFTAVAENAGSYWAGRALGIQNTAQNAVASLVPPTVGALIGVAGYGAAFLVAAAFPVVAACLAPVKDEARRSGRGS